MSTYREAIFHARSGGTAKLAEKSIRFLTHDEAAPILLERKPERRVVVDETGQSEIDGDGRIVIETIAPDVDPKRLGLFDVGGSSPVEFRPTEEDIVSDWHLVVVDEPLSEEIVNEPVSEEIVDESAQAATDWQTTEESLEPAPEAVDVALAETAEPTAG